MLTDKDLKPVYEKKFKEVYIKERRKVLEARAEAKAKAQANRKPILEVIMDLFNKDKKKNG